jgi:hypothetical protein
MRRPWPTGGCCTKQKDVNSVTHRQHQLKTTVREFAGDGGRGKPVVRIYCYTDLGRIINHFLNHRFYEMLNINKTETAHIFIKINARKTKRP